MLEKHGFLTWGETSKECYASTIAHLQKAEQCVVLRRGTAPVLGGPIVETIATRADLLNEALPALRGAVSATVRWCCTSTTRLRCSSS